MAGSSVHLDLDGAWSAADIPLPRLDLRAWGPRLRYCAPVREVEAFSRAIADDLPPFVLYGSGDFHYLAGIFVRHAAARRARPFSLVSFDNHPDWDIRPPRWACGGWINRALETPGVERASVWGCGNFELAFPSRLFANHRALRSGKLQVHAWAERQSPAVARRFDCMTMSNWRERFEHFARSVAGQDVYVTVDLDCLRAAEAVTNWENGLFGADDVAWAVGQLRERCNVIAGDLCGAWSEPAYARFRQRFAGNWDHPKLPARDKGEARRINVASFHVLWTALTGTCG